MKKATFLATITMMSGNALSVASVSDFIMPNYNHPWQKTRAVNIHPYRNHASLPQHSLHRHGLVDLATYGKLLLNYSKLPSQFEIITNHNNQASARYHFRLNGIKVCDLEVAIHSLPAHRIYYVGKLPTGTPHLLRLNWPSMPALQDIITASIPEAKIITKSRCLLNTAAGLLPVYDVLVFVGSLPYKLRVATDEIIHKHRLFSHAEGKFEVYQENHVRDKKRTKVSVDVAGTGYLDNDYFATVSRDPSIPRVHSDTNEFIYPEGDRHMPEINSFVHANKMMDWFIRMGFEPSESDKVILEVNPSQEDLSYPDIDLGNNAFYLPKQNDAHAHIFLSNGDGVILQNICNDSDVVSHELGHHIIYKHLQSFSKDGGILHEALADYFVYAKTNNSCLAESICPDNSSACYIKGKCLRSASTDLTYQDVQASSSPHKRGMVLSSALWNLRDDPDTSRSNIDKIIYESMQFFSPNTDQREFIEAILATDYKLFKGKYCDKIMHSMRKKGYEWHMDGLACDELDELPHISVKSKRANNSDDPYDYRAPSCGTMAAPLSPNKTNYALMLLALAPLLLAWQLRRNSFKLRR